MKKTLAALIFSSLAMPAAFASAQSPADGYLTSDGGVAKSGHGLCWRTGYWTESDRIPECYGSRPIALAPAQPILIAIPDAPPPARRLELAVLESATLFGFDSDKLTFAGVDSVRNLLRDASSSGSISEILVVGHADRIGREAYNHGLALRRAEAVAELLVDLGVPPSTIAVRERGESDPVVECSGVRGKALISCLAPNRRASVEVEVILGE